MHIKIDYGNKIYPLEKTEIELLIDIKPFNNTFIHVEKLYEHVPIKINKNNNQYIVNIILPKINYHDETGIFKLILTNDTTQIIKYIVIPRNN